MRTLAARPLTSLLALLVLLAPVPTLGAGWTQRAGGSYAKLGGKVISGSGAFPRDYGFGDSPTDVPGFFLGDVSLYVEAGLTDTQTAVLSTTPVGFAATDGRSTFYSRTVMLGLRQALRRADTGLQIAAEARLGTEIGAGEEDLYDGANEQGFVFAPAVESRAIASGALQAGLGLDDGWLSAATGLRWFSRDGLDPVVFFDGQWGTSLSENWGLEVVIHGHLPLGELKVSNVTGAGQTRHVSPGVHFSYALGQTWGLTLGLESTFFAQSSAAAPALYVGLTRKVD